MNKKKKILLLLPGCFMVFSLMGQVRKKVLFLGNSYTASNSLPTVLAQMARSTGDTVVWQSNTPGGYTLQGHASNQVSQNLIRQGNWDFVVLQEQSQLPSLQQPMVDSEVFPFAHFLDSVIQSANACAQTMFYMTWGRKNGDSQFCPNWPPVCTYEGMDSLLHLRYRQMAEQNRALLSPVGAVWRYIRSHHPDINLYIADNSHPSAAGTYAAACSFYTAIFRKNPTAIQYDFSLTADQAARIRESVKTVIFDSLLHWHIGEYDAQSDFSVTALGNNRIQCTDLSSNSSNGYWEFGDGTQSDESNPLHTYALGGTYTITRIVRNCFSADTLQKQVIACPGGYPGCDTVRVFSVYPNPVNHILWLEAPGRAEVHILNLAGQKIIRSFSMNAEKKSLPVSAWPSGVYIVQFHTSAGQIRRPVIKY